MCFLRGWPANESHKLFFGDKVHGLAFHEQEKELRLPHDKKYAAQREQKCEFSRFQYQHRNIQRGYRHAKYTQTQTHEKPEHSL